MNEKASSLLKDILQLPNTVLSMRELLLLAGSSDTANIYSRVNYYVKKGYLHQVRRGIFAKTKNYDPLEVAARLMTPSYISFETVLMRAGVVFQYYDQIFSASYRSRTLECDGQAYTFRRMKYTVLTNTQGIEVGDKYSLASPERAFLDTVYLNQTYYFDNLAALDWNKVYELVPLYENKQMENRLHRYKIYMKKQR